MFLGRSGYSDTSSSSRYKTPPPPSTSLPLPLPILITIQLEDQPPRSSSNQVTLLSTHLTVDIKHLQHRQDVSQTPDLLCRLHGCLGLCRSLKVHTRQASGKGTIHDVTPHPFFSSSVGVLGCKINTNRVAYWGEEVDCDNICVKLTNSTNGRTVHLLKIDHSGGAHDISYDAWNYLATGNPAKPGTAIPGGAMGPLDYEYVSADQCKDLITDGSGKLPLQGANSMNFLSSCLSRNTWVGKNYQLWNINDSLCHNGYDEKCTLAPGANQATCPHGLGTGGNVPITNPTDHKVVNIEYPTGNPIPA